MIYWIRKKEWTYFKKIVDHISLKIKSNRWHKTFEYYLNSKNDEENLVCRPKNPFLQNNLARHSKWWEFACPCRSLQDACLSRVEQVCLAGLSKSLRDFLARSSKIVLQGLARSAVTSKIYWDDLLSKI